MNLWHIAKRSLAFYRSTNLSIALGAAAATAVLTGALIVGSSMRGSLRQLTLERLGQIDDMLVADGFFSAQLADQIRQLEVFSQHYDQAVPAILFPGGSLEYRTSQVDEQGQTVEVVRRAGQVSVLGVGDDFWSLEINGDPGYPSLRGDVAIINQAVADDLKITQEDVDQGTAKLTVRVPKQTQLPADSALGRKTDLIESLVDLRVIAIVPTRGLGRFGMFPSQADPLNVYLPIEMVQDALARSVLEHKSDPQQANVILLSGQGEVPPSPEVSQQLRRDLRPSLEDYGLALKRVRRTFGDPEETIYDYWSLSSERLVLEDEAVASIERAFPQALPVFTYLANDIRKLDQKSGTPFSMVSGVAVGPDFPLRDAESNQPLPPIPDDQIVLTDWIARDLKVGVGDSLALTYFLPETTHGSQQESTVELKVAAIVALTEPTTPFVFRRRQGILPAEFDQPPTLANDPDLTPEVPGVTDAESIENWDLPFETADRLRSQDEDYWDNHRTTPKAYVNLATAQRLWGSRFGQVTNFRIPPQAGDNAALTKRLLEQVTADGASLGLHLVPIKRRGLAASQGSTPFDWLFLALSMFVIGSALILVSLLFRLALQQRTAEVGLLKAVGFGRARLRRVWLMEMSVVALLGSLAGMGLGIGYAALMIQGLTTWWVGAIARPFLQMHVSGLSLMAGAISGWLICVLTIALSLRRAGNQPVTRLLHGELESAAAGPRHGRRFGWLIGALVAIALVLAVGATQLAGESQAGAFMGAGFLMLAAGMTTIYRWLGQRPAASQSGHLSLARLAWTNAKRNPLRSTLTIGLVAVASFLIAAVSSFRLSPTDAGTAGYDWVARSSQPVFADLATAAGQIEALGEENQLSAGTTVRAFRYKAGEDASCNNLYQSTQPQVLGATSAFVNSFSDPAQPAFAWGGTVADTAATASNPWLLLDADRAHAGTAADPIPVILDKNTANYSLKIYFPGTVREVHYDTGETFHFRVVGFLSNTILQGSLIMAEADFVATFPGVAGYQYFLIRDGQPATDPSERPDNLTLLEDRLSDRGFDGRSATALLSNFMAVQNTYLSTFQTLGALGLLLGTFGLAAVQIRGVLERKRELGLMRAVGYPLPRLSRLVLLENAWLLLAGLGTGIGAALFTTVPHWLTGAASVPWLELGLMFAAILVVGFLAGWVASRNIGRLPILESLRGR